MKEFLDCLFSNNAVALAVATLIFLITVGLVAKRLIGFLLTLVLLFFAITSGFAIANNDIVREYLKGKTQESVQRNKTEDAFAQFVGQLFKILDEIKQEIIGQTRKDEIVRK